MLVYICFLLCCPHNSAYKSDVTSNGSFMAMELRETDTSKLWFHHLETSMNQILTDGWSRNVLTSYTLLSSKTHLMVDWCVISTSDADSLRADDVIHTHNHSTAPCGYVKVVNGIQPSTSIFHLRTIRQLVVQVTFLFFDMDSFSEDCEHVSSVQLCLTDPSHWVCPKSLKFCGYRKPWIQTTSVSLVEVLVVQLNVRYPCNLTFSYTSIEVQRAYVYIKYESFETMHITSNSMNFRLVSLAGYYGKWRLQQKLGNIIRFNDWQACCFVGSVEIYDGFENYYLIAQKRISNYSEEILDVATTYYLATLIFHLNHTLNKFNDDPLFALRFVKELVTVQFINTDNFSTTINNQGHLLHKILAFNMTTGGYPNFSVVVRTFKGWNDNLCSFGGYSFKIHIKLIKLTYDQGLFCNGQAPSVPFVGTHGPKHIVFGSFQYYFTIYAFGPWYNIDIDVIIHRSFCEGVFEPMHMCASVVQSYNNVPKDNHRMMSYINTSNYGIFCAAISGTDNNIIYELDMVNIKTCVIFQINSLLPSNAQFYRVRASMNIDITITIGPKHLLAYDITSISYIKLYFGTTDHAANSTRIKNSYRSSHKNVNRFNIDLQEIRQRLGLYRWSPTKNTYIQICNCSGNEKN